MRWSKTLVRTSDGMQEAIAPEIISASRSTDIPAFHAEWFVNRLKAGYVRWVNPFNRESHYVSFDNVRAIIFWSKNPEPLVPYLPELEKRGIAYYFQFTVNDYEAEGLEPNVPPLAERIATFERLSSMLGRDRVVWRFDPLILTDELDCAGLIAKIRSVGDRLHRHTAKLIFSFADISAYARVQRNLKKAGVAYREFMPSDMIRIGTEIGGLCSGWCLEPMTCGEAIDLTQYGVSRNKCVDDRLLLTITNNDKAVRKLFGYAESDQLDMFASEQAPTRNLKDPGQRVECGCVFSKDIGQYNTCPHMCLYCYANTSPDVVRRNVANHSKDGDSILAD